MERQTTSPATARETATEEPKLTLMMRLAMALNRPIKEPVEKYPLTSAAKAVIANLMGMR